MLYGVQVTLVDATSNYCVFVPGAVSRACWNAIFVLRYSLLLVKVDIDNVDNSYLLWLAIFAFMLVCTAF